MLELTIQKGGGYLSQACSSAELLAAMYGRILNLGPSTAPELPPDFGGPPGHGGIAGSGGQYHGEPGTDTDRFLISPAHYAVVIYAALVEAGRLDPEALRRFNEDGSTTEMIGAEHSPGFELTTGSFGQALSQAGGIALGRRLKGHTGRTWVFMSDGEFQEGQTWEALQAISFHGLDRIGVIVDVNGQQVDGRMEDVMDIEPLSSRLSAFGAAVASVDGHDIAAMVDAAAGWEAGKPLVILAYNDPARGIAPLDERRPNLHYVRLRGEEDAAEFRAFLEAEFAQS